MFEREVGPNNAGLQAPVAPPVRGGARGIAPAGRDVGPSNGRAFPEDWAQNGAILFRTGGRGSDDGGSLFVFQPSGGDPVPVAQTPATERNGRFSPDGAWITYQSDESGRNEIYVQPFPGTPGQRQRVTLGGGTSSQWGKKGTELYFLGPDNRLMVVNVTVAADRRTMELSTPKALFASPIPQGAEYDTRDGERFLVLMPVEASPPIVVLPKWTAGR
jgi:hypothetical protein